MELSPIEPQLLKFLTKELSPTGCFEIKVFSHGKRQLIDLDKTNVDSFIDLYLEMYDYRIVTDDIYTAWT